MTRRLPFLAAFFAALLASGALKAACVNPEGATGEQIYNSDHAVMQFCNGTDWISMAASGMGTEVDPHVGTLTAGKWCSTNGSVINCTNDVPAVVGGSSGQLQYNNGSGLGGAAAVTYATSGDLLMLTAQVATDIPLVVKGAASQTGNLQEWRNSSNVFVGNVTADGSIYMDGYVSGHYLSASDTANTILMMPSNNNNFIESGNKAWDASANLYISGINASAMSLLNIVANNTYFTGNVGIGVNTPAAKLSIKDDTSASISLQKGTYSRFWLTPNGDTFQIGGTGSTEPSTGAINIHSGNVGIGSTNPQNKLDVNGTVAATTFSGSGANLTSLNASNLASGTVPTARLGIGTASSSTYLRGDGTWAAPASLPTCSEGEGLTYQSGSWTCAPDTTPDAFTFTAQSNIAKTTLVTSNTINISSISSSVPVSVAGQGSPGISINGGALVTSGTITNGQTIQARLTSASTLSTVYTATVTVGTASAQWSVTTTACSGAFIGGYCWFSQVSSQSCDARCTALGASCDLVGTRDYAGSNGSDTNCMAILDALGQGSGSVAATSNGGGYGCAMAGGNRKRDTTPTTCSYVSLGVYRACACTY